MESSITSSAGNGEEVKSYRIHVSSKYLELTQKKLELTRLPHELLLPKGREWEDGTPKGDIEPLIDFWLEQYSWRDQEEKLNALPQFRTAIQPEQGAPLRIHFIHVRSPHAHAIPLLLIPPFPLTNLSLSKLIEPLSKPEDPITNQPFHLVIPSIPGLGFSDPLTAIDGRNTGLLETAGLFNKLMLRLGYQCYIATATGGGRESPAGIDYHLARLIGETFKENCLGVHLINPLLERPRWSREPLGWMKLSVAKFFHAEIFGYEAQDFAALKASEMAAKAKKRAQTAAKRAGERKPLLKDKLASGVVASVGLREPNTLAYALCDSPVGLLSLVCSTLKRLSPKHALGETEIINLTQQAWLPGPEAAIRFWAGALNEVDNFSAKKKSKSSVAVTIFGDAGDEGYMCPAWASSKHDVIFTQRVNGSAGLIVLEKPEIVVDGVRGLAKEVQKNDARIKARPLDEVVVDRPDQTILEEDEVGGENVLQLDVESPDTIVAGER